MLAEFDPRVVPGAALDVVRACQRLAPCCLAGGAVLAGAWLRHRCSRDVDLFFDELPALRSVVSALPSIALATGVTSAVVQDGGAFVRATLDVGVPGFSMDLVHETTERLGPAVSVDGVMVVSEEDLRASKLTCLLSRSEPRDLVDVLFLERAGYACEASLPLALRKDAGIDPAILAWLLSSFPTRPLPQMLTPLSEDELTRFRDDLSRRLRALAMQAG